MTSYYVYYRIDASRLDEVRVFVEGFFLLVKKELQIQGRWMRRRDEPSTFMEVYEDVQDGAAFEALLEREGAKLGLQRHVERFVCA